MLVAGLGVGAALALEAWRQRRRHGRASGRPNLLGVGALELQRHLEPDRKVEILAEDAAGRERSRPDLRPGTPADAPGSGPDEP